MSNESLLFKGGLNMETLELRQEIRSYLDADNFDGTGIRVAVMDSGISRAHPDLRNRVVRSLDFRKAKEGQDYSEYLIDNTEKNGNKNLTGHGTSVASVIGAEKRLIKINDTEYLISGIAPGVQIYDLQVMPDDLSHVDYSIQEATKGALKWCLDQPVETRPHIINISFGGAMADPSDPVENKPLSDYSPEEQRSRKYLILSLIKKGVFILTAISNDRVQIDETLCKIRKNLYVPNLTSELIAKNYDLMDTWTSYEKFQDYPGQYPGVISVGSVYKNQDTYRRSPFNRCDTYVHIYAPGQNIVTCLSPEYNTDVQTANISTSNELRYCLKCGNSFACPYIVGYLALILSHIKQFQKIDCFDFIKPSDIISLLKKYSTNIDQWEKSDNPDIVSDIAIFNSSIFNDSFINNIEYFGQDISELPIPKYESRIIVKPTSVHQIVPRQKLISTTIPSTTIPIQSFYYGQQPSYSSGILPPKRNLPY
jgi:subtilisin family serine protease